MRKEGGGREPAGQKVGPDEFFILPLKPPANTSMVLFIQMKYLIVLLFALIRNTHTSDHCGSFFLKAKIWINRVGAGGRGRDEKIKR